MHRASAGDNPTAPLSHHTLDSTHIAFGVVTAAIDRGPWILEGRSSTVASLMTIGGILISASSTLTRAAFGFDRRRSGSCRSPRRDPTEPEELEPVDITRDNGVRFLDTRSR